jgi:hypothetical protein
MSSGLIRYFATDITPDNAGLARSIQSKGVRATMSQDSSAE